MATKTLMTIERYDALPDKEGVKYELDAGVLITVLASPGLFHNMIRDRLGMKLYAYAEQRKLGLVSWETDFQLSEATVRIPDLLSAPSDFRSWIHISDRKVRPTLPSKSPHPRTSLMTSRAKLSSILPQGRVRSGSCILRPGLRIFTGRVSVSRCATTASRWTLLNCCPASVWRCRRSLDHERQDSGLWIQDLGKEPPRLPSASPES